MTDSKDKSSIIIIENGIPKSKIVISKNPTDQAKQAAQILQEYIERISGAKLDIIPEDEDFSGTRILVGQSQTATNLDVEVPSGFTYEMNEEGFVIKTVDKDLVIAGNEAWNYRGTIYAVYHFLEMLGCRWFFPGSYGEVVPKWENIYVEELDIIERPSFRMRNIWYSGWMPVDANDGLELRKWYDCNKMHALAGLSLPSDGSIIRLAPPEKYFESHPHIYAVEKNGGRSKEMLCLSEPETIQIAVKTITDTFRNDPKAFTFGFAPPDGHPLCYCERCQKSLLGFSGKGYGDPSLSDLWFKFVNQIAKEVKKEFPDRWIFTNGYANRVRPPEGIDELSDNIGIQLAVIQACTLHAIGSWKCWQRQEYEEILRRWTDMLPSVFIYDYDPGKGLDNLPFPALRNISHDLPVFKQRGVWGFWTEGQNSWMVTHLNYYIRAKLMWNVEEDVEVLVRDYCEKFYGKAAGSVERYIWMLEEEADDSRVHVRWGSEVPWKVVFHPRTMVILDDPVAQAEKLADTSETKLHVRVLRLAHNHLKFYLKMHDAASRGAYAQAVKWSDEMQRIRDEVAEIDPALLPSTPQWCQSHATSLEWYRNLYQELADKAGGDKGELVLMLPRAWEFKADPEDEGLIYQWYLPDRGEGWRSIETTRYWQLQSPYYKSSIELSRYAGKAWYRTDFYVPPRPKDYEKPLMLTFGGIYNQGLWIWVNGVLVAYRERQDSRRPFDVDTKGLIQPGKVNQVAVLVNISSATQRGGLYRRAFLYERRKAKGEIY